MDQSLVYSKRLRGNVRYLTIVMSFNQAGHHDHEKKFPWNAPGTAPVASPCGTLGGWPQVVNSLQI